MGRRHIVVRHYQSVPMADMEIVLVRPAFSKHQRALKDALKCDSGCIVVRCYDRVPAADVDIAPVSGLLECSRALGGAL